MHEFSYLTYKECQNHDHFLLENGQTMEKLIQKAGQQIFNWLNIFYPNQPLLGIIGKGNNGTSGWNANFGNGYIEQTAVSSAGTNASGNGIFEYDVPTGYTALSTKGINS